MTLPVESCDPLALYTLTSPARTLSALQISGIDVAVERHII
jgi:hypothetical protein